MQEQLYKSKFKFSIRADSITVEKVASIKVFN